MEYDGYLLEFDTDKRLFSPSKIDIGTLAMLSKVEFHGNDKILDLGCGYGVVGIVAGKTIGGYNVVMSDISDKAVCFARRNIIKNQLNGIRIIQSNGYENIPDRDFSLILSNPPYHSYFSVAKEFIEEGFKRIVLGGRMIMVTKRKEWYKNKFISVFGGVTIFEADGYYVFIAEKRTLSSTKKTDKDKGRLSEN
jgi:16S rRNA (guanine1207-N2)-methyltransferase